MQLVVETQLSSPTESLRLLRWDRTVGEVELVGANNTCERIHGLGSQLHLHDDAELTFVAAGEGRLFAGDFIGPFQGPELLLVSPNVPHCWQAIGPTRGMAVQFSIDDRRPLAQLPEFAEFARTIRTAGRVYRFRDPAASSLLPIFEAMAEASDLGRLQQLFRLLAKVEQLIDGAVPLSEKAYGGNVRTVHFRAIQEAISQITQHYSEPLELQEMVELSGLSRTCFSQEFKRITGRTFVAFVNEVRVDAVCRELMQTEKTIADIAFCCGFANLSNFNRVFRQTKGVSPLEYRKHELQRAHRRTPAS
ncbi:helix-turn-helix transcriptional regulator [Aeoliella mucimassa]|uniref:Regulatory protein SoxS n=1 Tax=Aeoliella mucimassa TaxID=2527972 RepID=A0A518AQI1_9BACT|nr:AraC family transcriptional regulator [Aeoliella mucimassa]QDU56981.1 Regulatory protein SoxS [Aeoliella mucimassa]